MAFVMDRSHPHASDWEKQPSTEWTIIHVDLNMDPSTQDLRRVLDLCESRPVMFLTHGPWTAPSNAGFAQLLDFLAYRGVEVKHKVWNVEKEYITPHSAFLPTRLKKLYNDQILDEWSKV